MVFQILFCCSSSSTKTMSILPKEAHAEENEMNENYIEKFRELVHKDKEYLALKRIRETLVRGEEVPSFIVKYLISGKDVFKDDLISFWQNVALVSALIGAIAVTVLLASPSRQEFLSSNSWIMGPELSKIIVQVYYALFAAAACSEICTVLVVTISAIHFNLMLSDDDMIWFVMEWFWFINDFAQILLVIGCIALILGCFFGSFIVGDNTTGLIVCLIGGGIFSILLFFWLYMIRVNKGKEKESIDRIRQILISMPKPDKMV